MNDNGQIELMATTPSVSAFTLAVNPTDPAATILGFTNGQSSGTMTLGSGLPATIQALLPVLASDLGVNTNTLGLKFDPATESLSFNLDVRGNYVQSVFLNFGNNLGPITIAGSANAMFSAAAEVKGTIGINLGALVADPSSIASDIFLANSRSVTVSASVSAPSIDLSAFLGTLSAGIKNGNLGITLGTGVTLNTSGALTRTPPIPILQTRWP